MAAIKTSGVRDEEDGGNPSGGEEPNLESEKTLLLLLGDRTGMVWFQIDSHESHSFNCHNQLQLKSEAELGSVKRL